MKTESVMVRCVLLAVVVLALAGAKAHALFTITLQEVGNNVVGSGTGSFNTTALTLASTGVAQYGSSIAPKDSVILLGSDPFSDEWTGISGPSSFGSGIQNYSLSTSGPLAGLFINTLALPTGYVSGTSLTNTSTWDGHSFSSLGVTPGTYTWTWGSGPTADSMVLNATAVPEPACLGLLAMGALVLCRRHRRT